MVGHKYCSLHNSLPGGHCFHYGMALSFPRLDASKAESNSVFCPNHLVPLLVIAIISARYSVRTVFPVFLNIHQWLCYAMRGHFIC